MVRMWRQHRLYTAALWAVALGAALALIALTAAPIGVTLLAFIAVALALQQFGWRQLVQPTDQLARELEAITPGTSERLPDAPEQSLQAVRSITRSVNLLLGNQQAAWQREEQAAALAAAHEARIRQMFDLTSAGIFVLDSNFRLIHCNPTVTKVIGATQADMDTLRGVDFIPMVFLEPDTVKAKVAEAQLTGNTTSGDFELLGLDGHTGWVHCLLSAKNSEGGPDHTLIEGVLYDITQRKRDEQSALFMADHDALTGLNNRASFERALDLAIAQSGPQRRPTTVMFLDLDGFKTVNDSQGHAAGDLVLIECAKRLCSLVRKKSDLVARLGGDELVLLLDNTDAYDPHVPTLAERVLERLRLPIATGPNQTATVGASIGIAGYPRHGVCRADVLMAADEAMYQVKRQGKNSLAIAPFPGQLAARPPADVAAEVPANA
jgi:diguanylate cyclase (GGDEF)-like protein/PAS domain S-box-containing protein